MFDETFRDTIIIRRRDGSRTGQLKASVQQGAIFMAAEHADVEEGDVAIRLLPDGKEEYFKVVDRGYRAAVLNLPAHYQMRTRRLQGLDEVQKNIEPRPGPAIYNAWYVDEAAWSRYQDGDVGILDPGWVENIRISVVKSTGDVIVGYILLREKNWSRATDHDVRDYSWYRDWKEGKECHFSVNRTRMYRVCDLQPTEKFVELRLIPIRVAADANQPDSEKARVMSPRLKGSIFETLSNTYRSLDVIGQGGAGIVHRVIDQDEKELALKILCREPLTREAVKRFKNEIRVCERLDHPNITKVLDRGFSLEGEQKLPFYVMRLYGTTLRKKMKTDWSVAERLMCFSRILDGVEAVHGYDVFHRDLKPENILIDEADDAVVVADFGIAHVAEELLFTLIETKKDEKLANFQYAAPEQRARGKVVDRRADIFALGLILNELFTGEIPQGTGYKRVVTAMSDYGDLDGLVEQMIQQEPDRRPQSIEDVKKQIVSLQHE